MKKSEREFLRQYAAAAEGEAASAPSSPFSRRGIGIVLASSLTALLAVAIIVPASLGSLGRPSGGNSGSGAESPGLLPTTTTYLNTDTLANRTKILTLYESNLAFLEDGYLIKKLDEVGKPSFLEAEASTDFQAGEPGTYEVRLHASSGEEASFSVEVIEEEVASIAVRAEKAVFYEGESPLPGDFTVEKERSDGTTAIAKESEIGLDLSSYDPEQTGTYRIGVYLKGNPAFREEVAVEVCPLKEIDLSGTYALVDSSLDIGAPLVRAFTIDGESGTLISEYSEICRTFGFVLVFEKGKVTIDGAGVDQSFVYDPAARSIAVSGIAGDPDMVCYPMSASTRYVKATGELYESDDLFCAENGYLNEETVNYLAYRGGGIYLEEELVNSVDASTYFAEDATVYLGRPLDSQVDISELVEGQYVDVGEAYPKSMRVSFLGGKLYFRSYYDSPEPYIATAKGDHVEIKTYGGSTLRYYPSDGRLEDYTVEGHLWATYRRIDREREIVVTCSEYHVSPKDYVIPKGTAFPDYLVAADGESIQYFSYEDNQGQFLYEDTTFEEGGISWNYLTDFLGHFGDYKDYWIGGSGAGVNRPDERGYYVGIYENCQLIDAGEVKIVGYETKTRTRILEVDFQAAGSTRLEVTYDTLVNWTMNGKSRALNEQFLAGFPFLGSYFKGNDYSDRLDITSRGSFVAYHYNPETDYRYQTVSSFRIIALDEERTSARLEVQLWEEGDDGLEHCSYVEAELRLEDGRYRLSYRGEEYVWQNVVS